MIRGKSEKYLYIVVGSCEDGYCYSWGSKHASLLLHPFRLKWYPKMTTQTLRTHQSYTGIYMSVFHPFLASKEQQQQQAFLYCLFRTKWLSVHGFIGFSKLGFEAGKASFVSFPALRPCLAPVEWCSRGFYPCSVPPPPPPARVLQSSYTAAFQNRKLKPREVKWVV